MRVDLRSSRFAVNEYDDAGDKMPGCFHCIDLEFLTVPKLTENEVISSMELGVDIGWIVANLWTDSDWEVYEDLIAPARAVYEAVKKSKLHNNVMLEAEMVLKKAVASAFVKVWTDNTLIRTREEIQDGKICCKVVSIPMAVMLTKIHELEAELLVLTNAKSLLEHTREEKREDYFYQLGRASK